MVFSSFTFLLLFMPLVLLGSIYIPKKGRMLFLLAASLFFYGWGSPLWLILLVGSMLVNYGGTRLMMRGGKRRRAVFVILIILNLLPLLWYKYAGFFRDNLEALTGWRIRFDNPVLPAGISFFTFQAMSYVIDVWRGKARVQRSLPVFGVYLSLFPQLVAGPIVRYVDLEEQLLSGRKPTWEEIREGLGRFSIGLAKKVLLADAFGRFWGQMNGQFTAAGALGAWLGLLAFSFQIYFDFSGYSDMALGLGKAMGFSLPENFDNPYRASSLTEFWRRWHITLTVWFREYVYIPLGGNRVSRIRRDLNVLIVWALTGFWHGAGWNYVIWGLYFALLLILEKRFIAENKPFGKLPEWFRRGLTFLTVLIGWGIFSGFAGSLLPAMTGAYGWGTPDTLLTCAAFSPLLILSAILCFRGKTDGGKLPRFAAPILFALCLAALAAQGYAPFVYFQF